MRRRDLLKLMGLTVLAPAAHAQQTQGMRRLSALLVNAKGDPEGQTCIGAFRQAQQAHGWEEDRNLSIEYHWSAGDPLHARA